MKVACMWSFSKALPPTIMDAIKTIVFKELHASPDQSSRPQSFKFTYDPEKTTALAFRVELGCSAQERVSKTFSVATTRVNPPYSFTFDVVKEGDDPPAVEASEEYKVDFLLSQPRRR